MTPLIAILNWWEPLGEFPRSYIASDVCFRLIPHRPVSEQQFRDFLTEELPSNRHVGRVLAIRAVVDYWFLRDQQERGSTMLLDAVETAGVTVKSQANAALGRMPQVHKETDIALDTWRQLRAGAISDKALVSVERAARLQRPPG